MNTRIATLPFLSPPPPESALVEEKKSRAHTEKKNQTLHSHETDSTCSDAHNSNHTANDRALVGRKELFHLGHATWIRVQKHVVSAWKFLDTRRRAQIVTILREALGTKVRTRGWRCEFETSAIDRSTLGTFPSWNPEKWYWAKTPPNVFSEAWLMNIPVKSTIFNGCTK